MALFNRNRNTDNIANNQANFTMPEMMYEYDDFTNFDSVFGINPNDPLTEFYPGAVRNTVIEQITLSDEEQQIEQMFVDVSEQSVLLNITEINEDINTNIDPESTISLTVNDFFDKPEIDFTKIVGEDIPVIYCIDGGKGVFAGETKIVGPYESEVIEEYNKQQENIKQATKEMMQNFANGEEVGTYELDNDSAIASDNQTDIEKQESINLAEREASKKTLPFEKREGHVIVQVTEDGELVSDKSKHKASKVRSSRVVFEGDRVAIAKRFKGANFKDALVYLICILAFVFVGSYAFNYFMENKNADEEFRDLGREYTMPEMITADLQMPDTSTTWPPLVDWQALKSKYPDVAGWIRIPGTSVDYPVLTNAEGEYYLHRAMNGSYSAAGSIFCDYENTNDLSQEHIVIYGHHMIYPSMFHDVAKYKDKDFFDQHRIIYFETPETTYVLKPIGMYYISPEEYNVRTIAFNNHLDFQEYLDDRLSRSDTIVYEDYDRATLDKLVTLITCTDSGNARQIVECIPYQTYPTDMIPNVIQRGEEDIAASLGLDLEEYRVEKRRAEKAAQEAEEKAKAEAEKETTEEENSEN